MNWEFWAGPVVYAVWAPLSIGIAWYASDGDPLLIVPFAVLFGGLAVWIWVVRLHARSLRLEEIRARVVEVVQGSPEAVWMAKSGFCYIRLDGRDIQIPNDRFRELSESTVVRIAYLPRSRVVVRVEASRTLGLDLA
jgi:hypothetical protein